jgi:hypothetical protein
MDVGRRVDLDRHRVGLGPIHPERATRQQGSQDRHDDGDETEAPRETPIER